MRNILLVISILFSLCVLGADQYPKQKIDLIGMTKTGKDSKLTIKDFESFKPQLTTVIQDPYNKDLKTTFKGISFSDFIKHYSKNGATMARVRAFDGYAVDIKFETIEAEKMILAYKDEKGFLTVDRMGPVRIIYPFNGVMDKNLLLKIGVNWVWQVKSIEFKK